MQRHAVDLSSLSLQSREKVDVGAYYHAAWKHYSGYVCMYAGNDAWSAKMRSRGKIAGVAVYP